MKDDNKNKFKYYTLLTHVLDPVTQSTDVTHSGIFLAIMIMHVNPAPPAAEEGNEGALNTNENIDAIYHVEPHTSCTLRRTFLWNGERLLTANISQIPRRK